MISRNPGSTIRLAVVGVGAMGASHARVLSGLKGAELIAVLDPDRERAQRVAAEYGCAVARSWSELHGKVDAICIAAPSAFHAELAARGAQQGLDLLVEKPLATSEIDALEVLEAVDKAGVSLLVGHIERFNPAVRQLGSIVRDDEPILAIDARRMSAASSRVVDVDVVSDLMVHDLDILLDLHREPVVDVTARGVTRGEHHGDHYVTAMLTFASGTLATLTASRVTQNQIRRLEVTTERRFLTVDYPSQELHIFRQGRIGEFGTGLHDTSRYVLDLETERVFVRRTEPLVAELSHFLDVVRGGAEPLIDGASALEVMRLIWRIRDIARRGFG